MFGVRSDVDSVYAGHRDVQDYKIGFEGQDRLDGRTAVGDQTDDIE